jgi:hypothetical protein
MSQFILPVFYAILQLLVLLLLGYVLRRAKAFSSEFFARLGRLVIRIGLPLYFVAKLSRTDISFLADSLVFPPIGIAMVVVAIGTSILVFKFLPLEPQERRAGVALAAFGNSGYIPLTLIEILPVTIPLVSQRFGQQVPVLFVGAYLLGYSPLLWSFGHFIMTGKGRRPKLKQLITPPIIGIMVGLALPVLGLKPVLQDQTLPFAHIMAAIDRMSNVTVPLALVCLGSLLADLAVPREAIRKYWTTAAGVVGVRLLVLPGLYFLLYFVLDLPRLLSAVHLWVIFLEMHTPTATNLSVMAADAGVNRNHAAFSIFVSYVAYLFLMPIYLTLFLRLPGILE